MQVSHSRIELFEKCPYKYKLRYGDKILTLPPDNAENALIIGTALHTGLEKGVDAAIKEYFMAYTIITDNHIEEAMKLEHVIPRAAEMLPKGEHELLIDNEHFKGFIDLITPNEDGTFDLYDFKYSNNVANYRQSPQLHLYKYFWEKQTGNTIRNMYFLFVPKVSIRQKKTEDLFQFRKRIQSELDKQSPQLVKIEFNYEKVIQFLFQVKKVLEATDFPKEPSYLCRYCEYQEYCEKDVDYMLLPKNERRNIEKIEKKVIWLYGSPFSGKTTFANKFPDPIMLNTDGNIKFVDAPYVPIKDQVSVEGRMTKRVLAWEVFKDAITELEKKQNGFKTLIVDLVEDTYESCRLYMYGQMGITHESDDSFKAWDKVRTEFLSTLKRLMNLEYENIILISHEDTSKDITKKGGDKITAIKPNLQEKTANKVAGMVDIVARVVADDKQRILSFKTNEVIFGGGRLAASTNEIPLDYEAFLEVYEEANRNAVAKLKGEDPKETAKDAPGKTSNKTTGGRKGRTKTETPPTPDEASDEGNMTSDSASEPVDQKAETPAPETVPDPVNEEADPVESEPDEPVEEAPKTRRSRKATEPAAETPKDAPASEPAKDEAPRTRRKRGE